MVLEVVVILVLTIVHLELIAIMMDGVIIAGIMGINVIWFIIKEDKILNFSNKFY